MNNNNTSTNLDDRLFGIELDEVPSTDSLQSKILQETRHMQQSLSEPAESLNNVTSLASLATKKYFAPVALAASLALMAVLLMPTTTTEQNIATVDDVEVAVPEDDWSFEEAMLFEDELMFANL